MSCRGDDDVPATGADGVGAVATPRGPRRGSGRTGQGGIQKRDEGCRLIVVGRMGSLPHHGPSERPVRQRPPTCGSAVGVVSS